ncbi:MAG: hypothetical protein BWY66_01424 [bacterium ADurb.Bin374]|nr:MAG: hypothetical protein BWY66_01424 [bacterium ADurb.Bin374]
MHLEPLLEPTEDRDRVGNVWLFDENRLETALQRGVLLDVLAILVECRRADAVQLAARQQGLEHVAGIHRTFGLAGPYDRVQLVDEQDDAALALLDLGQDGFQTLLELASELRAGDQGAHVERENGLVFQPFGNVASQNALGEPLGDGRLADAGLADQDGIVLRLARQDADDAADLVIAPDDRVELVLSRLAYEITTVFLERLVGLFGVGRNDALVAAGLGESLEKPLAIDFERGEQFSRRRR